MSDLQSISGTEVAVIFGGRSEIGLAVAQRIAPGRVIVLASRGKLGFAQAASELRALGARAVHHVDFDAANISAQATLLNQIASEIGEIDIAILAFGILGDQKSAEVDGEVVADILHVDFLAQATLLTELATRFRSRGRGVMVAFSSVAGQRVRRANYVYGSAKAGLDGFASGLGDALHGSNVCLILARPGFVIGRMTQGMKPAPYSSTPDQVAEAIVDRIETRRAGPVWIPWQLHVMFIVASFVPQWLWRRMPR